MQQQDTVIIKKSVPSKKKNSTSIAWLFGIVFLLALCATMLFAKVGAYPMIEEYGDEGFYLRLSSDVYRGIHIPLSLAHITSVSSQFPMTPLYTYILAAVYHVAGYSFISARAFSSLMGLLIILVTARFAYRSMGRIACLACLGGFLGMNVFWQTVQMTIPHGLASLLIISSTYCLYEFHQHKRGIWLFGVIGCAMFAPFLTYWAFFIVPLVSIFLWFTSRRHFWWSFLPLVVFMVYLFQRWLSFPQDFIRDLREMVAWQATGGVMGSYSVWGQIVDTIRRSWFMVGESLIVVIGILGVSLLQPRWLRWIVTTTTLFGALFTFRDHGSYVVVIMIPFFALGFGSVINRYFFWVEKYSAIRIQKRLLKTMVILSVLYVVGQPFYQLLINEVSAGYVAARQRRMAVIEGAARWLNERVSQNDFIVSPTGLYWKLHSRAVDGTWVIARDQGRYTGELGDAFRTQYRTDDAYFVFRTDIPSAKFVVFDRRYYTIDQQFIGGLGEVEEYLDIRTKHWPIVYENLAYQIRQNPVFPK